MRTRRAERSPSYAASRLERSEEPDHSRESITATGRHAPPHALSEFLADSYAPECVVTDSRSGEKLADACQADTNAHDLHRHLDLIERRERGSDADVPIARILAVREGCTGGGELHPRLVAERNDFLRAA